MILQREQIQREIENKPRPLQQLETIYVTVNSRYDDQIISLGYVIERQELYNRRKFKTNGTDYNVKLTGVNHRSYENIQQEFES